MSIAKDVLRGLKKAGKIVGLKSATLIKITPGTRTNGAQSLGTNPTTKSYPCSALIELAIVDDAPGAPLVQKDDRKIGILGASLSSGVVPAGGDKITIADIDGVTKTLRLDSVVTGDGVGALYEFIARL